MTITTKSRATVGVLLASAASAVGMSPSRHRRRPPTSTTQWRSDTSTRTRPSPWPVVRRSAAPGAGRPERADELCVQRRRSLRGRRHRHQPVRCGGVEQLRRTRRRFCRHAAQDAALGATGAKVIVSANGSIFPAASAQRAAAPARLVHRRSGVVAVHYATDDYNRGFAFGGLHLRYSRLQADRHDHLRQRNQHDGDDLLLSRALHRTPTRQSPSEIRGLCCIRCGSTQIGGVGHDVVLCRVLNPVGQIVCPRYETTRGCCAASSD